MQHKIRRTQKSNGGDNLLLRRRPKAKRHLALFAGRPLLRFLSQTFPTCRSVGVVVLFAVAVLDLTLGMRGGTDLEFERDANAVDDALGSEAGRVVARDLGA